MTKTLHFSNPCKLLAQKKQTLQPFLWTLFSLVLLVGSASTVLYYIFAIAINEFHSDCTDTLYWAEAAMQGNGLINPDFTYAALMPLGGNLFMQLWIPLFGISMKTQAFGMATFFVTFYVFLCLMLREMHFSLRAIAITVSGLLLTLCSSVKLREIFWGHIIYYSLGILFLVIGLFFVLHIRNLSERPRTKSVKIQTWIFYVLLAADFIICCTNSTTSIALFALPILGGVFCERLLDIRTPWKSRKSYTSLLILIVCAVGVVVGMKLGARIDGDVQAGYADAYSKFTNPDTWWDHVESLPLAFLQLLGLDVAEGDFLASIEGVRAILTIFYAMFLAVIPIFALCFYGKIEEAGVRILIWAHWVVTAFILVGYLCGLLSAGIWRLTPVVCTSTLVSFAFLRWIYHKVETKRLCILLCIPIAYLCLHSVHKVIEIPVTNDYKESINYKLGEYLKDQDLTYGYASFWHSQAITVLEDSDIKVRTVNFLDDERGLEAGYYQSNKNWFEAQPGQDRYFLLMQQDEKEKLEQSTSSILSLPHEEQTYEGYTIWIFNENIF